MHTAISKPDDTKTKVREHRIFLQFILASIK